MRKRVYVLGIVLGLLAPIVGVFLGLQVSTFLSNVFAFPIIAVAMITGTPFGMWSPFFWVVGFVLSIIVWTGIVAVFDKCIKKSA